MTLSLVISKLFERQLLIQYDIKELVKAEKTCYKGMVKIENITRKE